MRRLCLLLALALVFPALLAAPAFAGHTDPSQPLAETDPSVTVSPAEYAQGEGTWEHLRHIPANPGSDLKFFRKRGELYVSSGTLGQAAAQHVGQRILRLVSRNGAVAPRWVADHGSAACPTANPSGTLGLQHDVAIAGDADVLIDATDASGRCHDPGGGGLELVDISGLGKKGFKPREIHLTRHAGTSHTVTVDARRPWIVYNSTSQFSGMPWIDVMDVRSCLRDGRLRDKRDVCRPKVFRIPFQPEWSMQREPDGSLRPGSDAACHDITSRGTRIYCASLNATLIFDVSGLTNRWGGIRGRALSCTIVDGTNTGAKVTDCSGEQQPKAVARGWRFLGTYNHPGRDDGAGGTTGNSNVVVPSDEGVAVSHEADPTPDHKYMFVTDERGGGVVPPGASCAEGIDNTHGNGGIHVLDIRDPKHIDYAKTPSGEKAVWISDQLTAAPTFCTVHVIEQIPGEQRLLVAYYSQGVKIVDYFVDAKGRWTFKETASLQLPGAATWVAEDFKITRNADGTKTYFVMTSDISRGIDIVSWTGKPNPMGAKPPASAQDGEAPLVLAGLLVLPVAAFVGRRRRRRAELGA